MIFLVFEILLYLILAAALGFLSGWLWRGGTVRKLRRSEAALREELETLQAASHETQTSDAGTDAVAATTEVTETSADEAAEPTAADAPAPCAAEPLSVAPPAAAQAQQPARAGNSKAARPAGLKRRRGRIVARHRLRRPRRPRRSGKPEVSARR